MRHTEQFEKVMEALAKAQSEFPQIDKNQEVEVKEKGTGKLLYKFQYADLTEIVNKTRPALSKNGISYTQSIALFPDVGVCYFTRLMCGGQWLDTGLIPAKQVLSCGSMKDTAAIATYGKRLSLSEALGVAADDDMDAPESPKEQPQPSAGRTGQNQQGGSISKQTAGQSGPKSNQSNQSNSTGQTSNTPPPKMTEDQSEQIANLMIKHSLDGKDVENFFLTAFAVKTDAVTFGQADYLIKMLAVDVFSSLDLSLAAGDLKTKREARNQDPADYVIDDRILSEGSLFKGKKLRQIDEKSLKAFIEATDQDLKAEPKPPEYKLIYEANFKAKSFLKSMGV